MTMPDMAALMTSDNSNESCITFVYIAIRHLHPSSEKILHSIKTLDVVLTDVRMSTSRMACLPENRPFIFGWRLRINGTKTQYTLYQPLQHKKNKDKAGHCVLNVYLATNHRFPSLSRYRLGRKANCCTNSKFKPFIAKSSTGGLKFQTLFLSLLSLCSLQKPKTKQQTMANGAAASFFLYNRR
jgi:hypothetical protein